MLDLIKLLEASSKDTTAIVSLALTGAVLFMNAYGAFYHNRSWLSTFAAIAIIAMIVGFVSKAPIYVTLGMSIVLIILSLAQSELLKRNYH